ncbi:ABC transporter ATP-binding protein [Hypericibacter adhaerens]|uniref:ABC transporter ATP-binding protein n=1 Tax=Hypericibacter adhaerens TaxID=2602016 RepID=A0A5J6N1R1_9PROT|nr:ABC transporter ATP-binding protein [Hypericibacter adhaerens]QEX23427.1 ABC transporter ATP-binding protein [Hypericibacter adhaerens]
MILTLDRLNCFYGRVQVLRDLSLTLAPGEVLCLLGRNGAGKTTTLKTVMGLIRPRSGRVLLGDEDLSRLPAHEIPRRGIAYVPQGRRLFAELTVEENLTIGLMARHRGEAARERVLTLFPVLKQRLHQPAGTLSGGEQEMLAVARALCLEPRVLLLDEPTEGLMPSMIAAILETVRLLKREGVATILVEQRVGAALSVADRVAFIENGTVMQIAAAASLHADRAPIERYVGVGLSPA